MGRKHRKPNRYKDPKNPELRARNDEIVRARLFGGTIRGIAAGFGLSPSLVHAIVAGVHPIITKPKRPRKSRQRLGRWLRFNDLKRDARSLRMRGYSYREIAEQMGISHGCAYNAAHYVRIIDLHGRAWLSHEEGRPKAWKRELLAQHRPGPPVMPLARELARGLPGYAVPI